MKKSEIETLASEAGFEYLRMNRKVEVYSMAQAMYLDGLLKGFEIAKERAAKMALHCCEGDPTQEDEISCIRVYHLQADDIRSMQLIVDDRGGG